MVKIFRDTYHLPNRTSFGYLLTSVLLGAMLIDSSIKVPAVFVIRSAEAAYPKPTNRGGLLAVRKNRFFLAHRDGRWFVINLVPFKILADDGSRSLCESALQLPELRSKVDKLTGTLL